MGYISNFETNITTAFSTVVTPASASVLAAFRPAFVLGFSIWILMVSYDIAWGKSEDGLTTMLNKMGKIFLIGAFALYGWPMFADMAIGLAETFVAALGGSGGSIASVIETNLVNPLGVIFKALMTAADTELATYSGVSVLTSMSALLSFLFTYALALFCFGCLALAATIVAIITMGMYMVAFATLQLLLAVGPFFILCAAFPVTQRFAESWTGGVVTAGLGMGFTAFLAVVSAALLGLPALSSTSATWAPATMLGDPFALVTFLSTAAFALLLVYMYFKVFDLAASLGGGINMGGRLVSTMRNFARAMPSRGARTPAGGAPGAVTTNTIRQGGSPTARTLGYQTGAAVRTVGTQTAIAAGRTAIAIGQTARLAGQAGRYAYNRSVAALRART